MRYFLHLFIILTTCLYPGICLGQYGFLGKTIGEVRLIGEQKINVAFGTPERVAPNIIALVYKTSYAIAPSLEVPTFHTLFFNEAVGRVCYKISSTLAPASAGIDLDLKKATSIIMNNLEQQGFVKKDANSMVNTEYSCTAYFEYLLGKSPKTGKPTTVLKVNFASLN